LILLLFDYIFYCIDKNGCIGDYIFEINPKVIIYYTPRSGGPLRNLTMGIGDRCVVQKLN